MSEPRLSHLGEDGRARMVDVGAKPLSERRARARARLRMSPATAGAVAAGTGPKGEVLGVARLAGIQAAKQTPALIPLAHPIALSFVDVEASVDEAAGRVELVAEARTTARTGVEMEAMTACAVAALTVYDMVKGVERGVELEGVVLLEKSGGRSDWRRDEDGAAAERAEGATGSGPPETGARPGPMRAAIITVSTSKAAGEGADESGERLAALAVRLGAAIAGRDLIPDQRAQIEARLRHWADEERCELVLTSGGTGFSPSDVTPEATRAVLEREAPGLAEAMRAASREHTPHWMLSRAVAGTRGDSLIVNFPGSPRAVDQAGEAIAAALPHAIALLHGRPTSHSHTKDV